MKKSSFRSRLASIACLVLFACLPAFSQTGLVISQVYGGGGNASATYTNDFIELYNATSAAINLGGLSVQYASATGTSWNAAILPTFSLAAGHYFLIQAAAGTTTAASLPTPDLILTLGPPSNVTSTFTINLSATAGKVALVTNTTPLTVACPTGTTILDFVGYGTTANCFEGAGPAPTTSNNATSIIRTVSAVDTNVNSADFSTVSPPNPRNSTNSGALPPPVVPTLAIHTIQGSKSTTAMTVSPYAGQKVTTTGVITTIFSTGFFIQSRDIDADSDLTTPEGIEIFTSSAPASTLAIGNYVSVTGTIATYPAVTASHTPATEMTGPTVTVLAASSALPAPITLTSTMLTPSGGLYQLTPYEGMRVSVPSMTSISGTNGSITAAGEPTETPSSTGYFYAVISGTPRPFREPGIDIRDPAVPGVPPGVALFDDNPERILVDSILAGGTSIEISTGAVLTSVTGVLDFTFSSDSFYDPSRLILDATYPRTNVTPGMAVVPVPLPASTEFTVASFNIERFYNPAQATPDDLYFVPAGVNGYNGSSSTAILSTGQTFISEAVDVTAAAYATRLKKVSLAIRTVLNMPDIVTLEEVENQNVANDIAAQVNTDAGISNLYTGYSTDNSTFYSQDGTGISVGFLVKNTTVDKLAFTQYGAGETFTPTTSSSPIVLNDRPWLVLSAGLKRAASKDYPITVIVNHMKALTGENSPTSTSTRQKKELQAEDIAKYIQTLQVSGAHVISGGDFNAFEFSDGYTDTLATYTNVNVLPSTQIVLPGVAGLVTPPLVDLALNLPANQRWSYVEDGSAQILDHMVVTSDLVAAGAHLAYAHLDADFPLTSYNDPTTAARTSDHDAAVGYFTLPAPVLAASLGTVNPAFPGTLVGTPSTGQVYSLANTGEGPITISSITATGDFAVSNSCGGAIAINSSCSANVVFTPTAPGTRTGILTFNTNVSGAAYTLLLTGTGNAPLPTIGSTALTFPSTIVSFSSPTQTITINNTATIATTVSGVTVTGDFAQTNTCGTSIPASSTCTVVVTFKPVAAGTRTGTVTVTTTGQTAAVLSASLTGTATALALPTLSTASLSYSGTTITVPSAAQTITVTNSAPVATAVSSVAVTGDFAQTNTCGTSIPASSACTVSIIFTPTATGIRSGTLTVTTTGFTAATLTSALSGSGSAPVLPVLNSSALTFAGTTVSLPSAAQTVTVINTAPLATAVASVVATGDFAQTNTCGTSIPASGACTISVIFTPTATGTRAGGLTVTTTGLTAATLSASLTGTGNAPALPTLGASALTFASTVVAQTSAAQTIIVSNTAPLATAVSSIAVTGDYSQTNTCGTSIPAGGTCTISVVFTPTTSGTRAGGLTVTTSGLTAATLTASLTGTAYTTALPTLSTSALTFAGTSVSFASSAQTITVNNTATVATTVSGIAVTGDYSQTNTCGTSIPASGTCLISVLFTPTAVGARPGTLTVTSTGLTAATLTASLTGTGLALPLPTLSSAALTFSSTALATSSAVQTVTVTNSAPVATSISAVAVTGDFSQTNTCGTSIPAASTCIISVTFKPTVAGARTGVLTVTSTGLTAATLSATLTGTGGAADFTFGDPSNATTTNLTIAAGGTAAVNLTLTPVNGYTGTITFTCTAPATAPLGVNCVIPTPVTLGAAASTQTFTFITTSRTSSGGLSLESGAGLGLATGVLGLSGLLMLFSSRARRFGRFTRIGGLLALLLAFCLPSIGCGSGSGANPAGTAAGAYAYTITASTGTLTHTETVNLTVQ